MRKARLLAGFLLGLAVAAGTAAASAAPPSGLELIKRSFFYGREYFILRSGRAQMVVQADQADLGPALTYFVFDARNSGQSAAKQQAFNFDPVRGVAASGLAVELGGFAFTALGHRMDSWWRLTGGIPSVEAQWWAGGIRVTESIAALGEGLFRRSVRLEGAHLVGDEPARLKLTLPPGPWRQSGSALCGTAGAAQWALAPAAGLPALADAQRGLLEIGPLVVRPNQEVAADTFLLVQIPPGSEKDIAARAERVAGEATRLGNAARREWALTSSVNTKDAVVRQLADKARFGLAGMIADDGTMDAGIFCYGNQWVRDSSNTALGALHAGHFELAHAVLVRMLTKMISRQGVTMIGGAFESPDKEQFDQMGELLHLLRSYRDWTGDDGLVRQHREVLLATIERPLQPQFRDATGMVHNRREFWERTFDDAYELAYQTYVVLGLREAAELAPSLGAEDRAARWRAEADKILDAMLHHPTRALVHEGRLIKRRNLTGEVADRNFSFPWSWPDAPYRTERHHRLLPDATMALPIAFRLVDPNSPLARRTLDQLEELWNMRWSDGGYDRYHTSSQMDQPGPWPFATAFILRGQHEAGMFARSRRSLEWLANCPGGRGGAWYEEIPSSRLQAAASALLPWTSGEVALFVVRHYLGVDFDHGQVVLRPKLYPHSPPVSADLRFRKGRLRLEIDGSGPVLSARLGSVELKPASDGSVRLPKGFESGAVVITTQEAEAGKP